MPRIPPQRVGGGVFYSDANWLMRLNLLHAFAQNDVAVIAETPTAGYNLLKAEISYTTEARCRAGSVPARSWSAWSAITC